MEAKLALKPMKIIDIINLIPTEEPKKRGSYKRKIKQREPNISLFYYLYFMTDESTLALILSVIFMVAWVYNIRRRIKRDWGKKKSQ